MMQDRIGVIRLVALALTPLMNAPSTVTLWEVREQ